MRAEYKERKAWAGRDSRPSRKRPQPEGTWLASEQFSPQFLQAVPNSHSLFRAYILAEAALVRGPLPRRQRRQVALAVANISRSSASRAARPTRCGSSSLPGKKSRLPATGLSADPTTNALLDITQATILWWGKISAGDFLALQKAGFSCVHIAEIVASIALKLFSHRFTRLGQTKPALLVLKPGTGSAEGLCGQPEPGACRRD